jgi:hypothetical protein
MWTDPSVRILIKKTRTSPYLSVKLWTDSSYSINACILLKSRFICLVYALVFLWDIVIRQIITQRSVYSLNIDPAKLCESVRIRIVKRVGSTFIICRCFWTAGGCRGWHRSKKYLFSKCCVKLHLMYFRFLPSVRVSGGNHREQRGPVRRVCPQGDPLHRALLPAQDPSHLPTEHHR